MLASEIVRALKLTAHPEGGHFREIGRSSEVIPHQGFAERYRGDRRLYTVIYYLLQHGEVSRFHRLQSDEIWCLLVGGPLYLHCIAEDGQHTVLKLGTALEQGEQPQSIVPRRSWFGACLESSANFALASCTVIPGFEFADFELGNRDRLLATYPAHREIIELLS